MVKPRSPCRLGVFIDLKLSGWDKDLLQILVSMDDLGSDQQCASWSLILSWNESDHGMRHNQISNWKKTTFISIICQTSAAFDHIRNGCSTRLGSAFPKVKAIRYFGKTLPKNLFYLQLGSGNILSNLRCTPWRPWIPIYV